MLPPGLPAKVGRLRPELRPWPGLPELGLEELGLPELGLPDPLIGPNEEEVDGLELDPPNGCFDPEGFADPTFPPCGLPLP